MFLAGNTKPVKTYSVGHAGPAKKKSGGLIRAHVFGGSTKPVKIDPVGFACACADDALRVHVSGGRQKTCKNPSFWFCWCCDRTDDALRAAHVVGGRHTTDQNLSCLFLSVAEKRTAHYACMYLASSTKPVKTYHVGFVGAATERTKHYTCRLFGRYKKLTRRCARSRFQHAAPNFLCEFSYKRTTAL